MSEQFDISRFMKNLRRTGELYNAEIERVAAMFSLTRPEADVILFLTNNPELDTARDMVMYRGFSKAYVSKAVELLSNGGLLETVVERCDRRYQHLKLTDKALPIAEGLRKNQQAFIARIFEGISQPDIDLLLATVAKIGENLS